MKVSRARLAHPLVARVPETAPMTELLTERRADGVVLLTLNLPARRNAMSIELTEAWAAAMAEPARTIASCAQSS